MLFLKLLLLDSERLGMFSIEMVAYQTRCQRSCH
jgi:hypothetical protein